MTFMFTMEDSQTFDVMTLPDTLVEGDETLSVTITNINGPANAGPDLPLTITDDDGKLTHPHINMHISSYKQIYIYISLADNALFYLPDLYSTLLSSSLQ